MAMIEAKVEYVTCPRCGSYQVEQRPSETGSDDDIVCVDCGHFLESPAAEDEPSETPDNDTSASER